MAGSESIAPLKPGDPPSVGRFELHGRLGVGGMGVAFLAHSIDVHNTDAATVVVKMIQLDFADDPDARRRFRREVLAASAVETPFVPEVLASDVSAERQWVAMEYIAGPTLEQLIRADGARTRPQQRALGTALAAALSDLHSRGLVHRDLKPSNIISTDAGPRIVDFGIAVLESLSGITRTGGLAPGSPGWMSPEQLDPYAATTSAADIFSWGCLCWYAATGTSPFNGESVEDRLSLLRNWTGVVEVPAELDRDLAPWVARALEASPDDRPTAADLVEALAADGESVSIAQVQGLFQPGSGRRADWESHDLPTSAAPTQHTPRHQAAATVSAVDVAPAHERRRRPWRSGLVATVLLAAAVGIAFAGATLGFLVDAPNPPADASDAPSTSTAGTPSSHADSQPADSPAKETPAEPTPTRAPVETRPPATGTTSSVPTTEYLADYGGNDRVGFGNVKLGMTLDELLATGDTLAVNPSPAGCTDYPLVAGGTATYSDRQGRVVYITFADQMATSRGIVVGSTETAAAQAYPDGAFDEFGTMTVPVAEGVTYLFASDRSGYVVSVVLLSRAQDCAG